MGAGQRVRAFETDFADDSAVEIASDLGDVVKEGRMGQEADI